jgi:signal transduction histidine kinase
MLIIMTGLAMIGSVVAFLLLPVAGFLILILSVLLILTAVLFTRSRYRDISQLSGYLRKIYSGDYSLDLRDNQEGELSILKNEIYKVTLILSSQAQLLENEKKALADAISDISHQLKTPLTSMSVMAELLQSEKLEAEKRREFSRNLEAQISRMEWLLSSLLKLAKMDAGTIRFKQEEVSVKKLVEKATKPLLIPMELKEQTLVEEGEAEASFLGDADWTCEALINIMKNCIEHTQTGGTITIHYSQNPIYTEIIISDNGSGIDKKDLPFLFQRFYKGKNASPDSVGIGLAMAQSIIDGQNGNISVTSKKGDGTSFSIKFYQQIS